MRKKKIEQFKMPWRTTKNPVDCGVFLMRHMETYNGEDEKTWNCGFANQEEKQPEQIEDLRRKYAAKILLHDINEARDLVQKQVEEYMKLPGPKKISLQKTSKHRILHRLNMNP